MMSSAPRGAPAAACHNGVPLAPAKAMPPIISIKNLSKTYASGFAALKSVDLDIRRGEIFALLGPNGAGKTTLISIVCGIVNATEGTVRVDGKDIRSDYRETRALIGLVPQELTTDAFETPWGALSFSRGLFGKPPDPARRNSQSSDTASRVSTPRKSPADTCRRPDLLHIQPGRRQPSPTSRPVDTDERAARIASC